MRQVLILLLIFLPVVLIAQEEALQFEQANQLYRNGNYQKAAEAFEQILNNGFESSALYYNLGNSYFKLQNVPSAILSYERAKRIAPHDDDILYNLRLANLRVIDKIEPIPQLFIIEWWKAFVDLFSSSAWAMIAIAGLWIAACTGALFLIARSTMIQRMSFIVTGMVVVLTIAAFIGMFQRMQTEHNAQSAIVVAQSIAVKSAPDMQSTELFVLHEGVKVAVLDAVGEWRKIRLADGKIGWLTVTTMTLI